MEDPALPILRILKVVKTPNQVLQNLPRDEPEINRPATAKELPLWGPRGRGLRACDKLRFLGSSSIFLSPYHRLFGIPDNRSPSGSGYLGFVQLLRPFQSKFVPDQQMYLPVMLILAMNTRGSVLSSPKTLSFNGRDGPTRDPGKS